MLKSLVIVVYAIRKFNKTFILFTFLLRSFVTEVFAIFSMIKVPIRKLEGKTTAHELLRNL